MSRPSNRIHHVILPFAYEIRPFVPQELYSEAKSASVRLTDTRGMYWEGADVYEEEDTVCIAGNNHAALYCMR